MNVLHLEVDVNRHAGENAQDGCKRLGRPLEKREANDAHTSCKIDRRRPKYPERIALVVQDVLDAVICRPKSKLLGFFNSS